MMKGLFIAIGEQGSGKTVMITKLATEDHLETNRKIYSNYTLNKLAFERITLKIILDNIEKKPDMYNNSIILLDEIHLYVDSYEFMSKHNKIIQNFFSQLRKRNILILATAQYIMNVDIRVRRQCKNVFDMEHIYKDLFKVTTSKLDGYITYPISSYNVVLSDYYDSYDTNELITE